MSLDVAQMKKETTEGSGELGDAQTKYLSQKVRQRLDLFLMDPHWTIPEIYNAIISFGSSADWIHSQMESLKDWRKDPDFAPNEGAWRLSFEDELRMQFWLKLSRFDVLTNLAIMDPYNQAVVAADSYKERSNYFFLKTFSPFGYGVFTGIPGSGKTHQAVNFIDMSLQGAAPFITKPFKVCTNITILDTPEAPRPEGISQVNKLSEIIITCIKNMRTMNALTNIVLDELPQTFNRKRATSGAYVNMEKMLLLLRKVGGNFIAVIQRPEDVPSVISSFSHMSMHKVSKDRMIFKRDEETYVIKDVPQTRLKFDTTDIASFIIDINMDELHAHLIGLPKGTDQIQAISDFLSTRGQGAQQAGVTERDVDCTIKTLVELRNFTYEEVGEIMGISASTAWKRHKGKANA